MSIAEELAAKHMKEHYRASSVGELPAAGMDATVAAINEALERAAQECEAAEPGFKSTAAKLGTIECAARIRALKSPAGPVQPIDTNAAPVDQRRTE